MAKPFRLLREKLPLEIQARAKARANEMLEEIALQELCEATIAPDAELRACLAEKHEVERRRFFALEEQAEKEGLTPEEWVRQNCPNGKDLQGRSLAQILDGIAEGKQQFDDSSSTIGERLEMRGLLGEIDSSQPDSDSPLHRDPFFYLIADELEQQGFKL